MLRLNVYYLDKEFELYHHSYGWLHVKATATIEEYTSRKTYNDNLGEPSTPGDYDMKILDLEYSAWNDDDQMYLPTEDLTNIVTDYIDNHETMWRN